MNIICTTEYPNSRVMEIRADGYLLPSWAYAVDVRVGSVTFNRRGACLLAVLRAIEWIKRKARRRVRSA